MYNRRQKTYFPPIQAPSTPLPSRLHRLPSHLRGKATGRRRNSREWGRGGVFLLGNGVGVGYNLNSLSRYPVIDVSHCKSALCPPFSWAVSSPALEPCAEAFYLMVKNAIKRVQKRTCSHFVEREHFRRSQCSMFNGIVYLIVGQCCARPFHGRCHHQHSSRVRKHFI